MEPVKFPISRESQEGIRDEKGRFLPGRGSPNPGGYSPQRAKQKALREAMFWGVGEGVERLRLQIKGRDNCPHCKGLAGYQEEKLALDASKAMLSVAPKELVIRVFKSMEDSGGGISNMPLVGAILQVKGAMDLVGLDLIQDIKFVLEAIKEKSDREKPIDV